MPDAKAQLLLSQGNVNTDHGNLHLSQRNVKFNNSACGQEP